MGPVCLSRAEVGRLPIVLLEGLVLGICCLALSMGRARQLREDLVLVLKIVGLSEKSPGWPTKKFLEFLKTPSRSFLEQTNKQKVRLKPLRKMK